MSKGKGPTRAAKMRAWIAEHGPVTSAAIREGLGLTPQQLKSSLYELVAGGMVVSQGEKRPRTYSAGRPAREWGIADAAALAERERRRLAYNAQRRRKGDRTQAQIQADAIQKRIDAMTAKLAADNANRKPTQAAKEYSAADRRDAARANTARLSDALAGAPAKHDDFPDTEAFIAANRHDASKYQRLAPNALAHPVLRFTY